jgi:hypothetical protein
MFSFRNVDFISLILFFTFDYSTNFLACKDKEFGSGSLLHSSRTVTFSVADPDPEGSETFGRIRSGTDINVLDPDSNPDSNPDPKPDSNPDPK